MNLADLWLYMAPFRPDQGARVEDFDETRCVQLPVSGLPSSSGRRFAATRSAARMI